MAESILSKAATMEIPINSNGDTGTLAEDDSLEQVSIHTVSHVSLSHFKVLVLGMTYSRRGLL